MKILLLPVTLFALVTSNLLAQDTTSVALKNKNSIAEQATWAVGLSFVNTTGPGLEVAYKINDKFNVRLSGNYLDASSLNLISSFFPKELDVSFTAKTGKIGLLGEYNLTNFVSINAGVVYNLLDAEITVKSKDSVKVNDAVFTPAEFGEVKATIKPKGKIAPYLGLGFGKTLPNKRIGFKIDVGTFYQANPVVELTATKFLAPTQNASNQKVLENITSKYAFYPVLNMSLQFKIK